MTWLQGVGAAWLVVCATAACGGSNGSSSGIEGDSGGNSSDASRGSTSSSGADATTSSSGVGGSSSGGSGSSSSASSDTGASSGSSGADDSGADATIQDSGGQDSAVGSSVRVLCGDERDGGQPPRCNAGEVCCVDWSLIPASYTCQAASAACSTTTVLCASASDCPAGNVCCGVLATATSRYGSLSCVSSCTVQDGGSKAFEFCDLNAPQCPASQTCGMSVFLMGYGICG